MIPLVACAAPDEVQRNPSADGTGGHGFANAAGGVETADFGNSGSGAMPVTDVDGTGGAIAMPGGSRFCVPGPYSGAYEGIFMDSITGGLVPVPVTGPFDIVVGMPGDDCEIGEEFCVAEIEEGATFSMAWGGFEVSGPITGGVDCATGAFEATCVGDLLTTGIPTGTCTFEITGHFDPDSKTIGGPMSWHCNQAPSMGDGSVEVVLQP